jgi:hypothetical protein
MAHTVRTAMRVLNKIFPAHMISRRGNLEWPARSPDLNTCNFFLWGYIKSKVCEKKPRTMVTWNRTSGMMWLQFLPPCCNKWCRTSRNACGNVLTTRDATSQTLYSGSKYCN